MGRSREDLASKIHTFVNEEVRSVALRPIAGQVHDSVEAKAVHVTEAWVMALSCWPTRAMRGGDRWRADGNGSFTRSTSDSSQFTPTC